MEFLSNKGIIHGNLAARNILIDDNFVAKVADFGLSQAFYQNAHDKIEDSSDMPWKWMALEYLEDYAACCTVKSDVWSFGIVIWETLSLGRMPYISKSIENATEEIKNGYRLPCPDILTDVEWLEHFYQMTTHGCWQANPDERSCFADLIKIMENYLSKVEMSQHNK